MMRPRSILPFALALTLSILADTRAGAQEETGIAFNETYIDALAAEPSFDIGDIMAAFGHVFAALSDRVKVYPTENYYYFTFGHGGQTYAGNMRLDVKDRDEGILHFAYFNKIEDWNTELTTQYRPLSTVDGVRVVKEDELVYRVTYKDKSVVFALNDLRGVTVPADKLGEGEEYLGPVFDESGLRFYLLFHPAEKRFMFVLDESGRAMDELLAYSEGDPSILLGMRTGFAFYRDRYLDRKILIGVFGGNVENNNYFDGPFDQLPDNFIDGDALQKALLTAYPDLEGEIDAYGNFKEQEGRVLVNPYINYSFLNELETYRRCGDAGLSRPDFYACLQPAEGR